MVVNCSSVYGALISVSLRVNVFVAGRQIQLGGLLLQDLVADHLVQTFIRRMSASSDDGVCGLSPMLAW